MLLDNFGNVLETCERDGERENYLAPRDHPIGVALSSPVPQGATCVWTFDDGDGPLRQLSASCDEEVNCAVRYGRTTVATVDIPLGDGTAQRAVAEIAVRDLLIAGLGNSIAAGEGDPDNAVQLEGGFCFKRFLSGGRSFRPTAPASPATAPARMDQRARLRRTEWARHGARSINPTAIVRFTAIRCAPRSRSPSSSRTWP